MIKKIAIFCDCGEFIGYQEDFMFRYISAEGVICPKCKRVVIASATYKIWQGNIEEKLYKAMDEFAKGYEGLILDERDNYTNFEAVVKKHLGFIPTKKHKDIYFEYKDYKKKADKAMEIAADLATAYRKESRVTIAELETKYYEMVDVLG